MYLEPSRDVEVMGTEPFAIPSGLQDDRELSNGVTQVLDSMTSGPWNMTGTRSSDNWSELPGSFDHLNLRAVFQGTGAWDLPVIPAATSIPRILVPYNSRSGCSTGRSRGAAVHFFLDDYRFETLWTKPTAALQRVMEVGLALSPDFSIYPSMPLAMQLWQVYRNRWCHMWMHWHGVEVIPTVTWSDARSYDFCFTGIAPGSVVAISSVGIRDIDEHYLLRQGLLELERVINPRSIVCYGNLGESMATADDPWTDKLVVYPTRWEQHYGRARQEDGDNA